MSHWADKPAPAGLTARAGDSPGAGTASGQTATPAARAAWDQTILASHDLNQVLEAFQGYWQVNVGYTGDGVSAWDIPTLRAIHMQLKLLPPDQANNKDWLKLLRGTGGGGSMGGGTFTFGQEATAWAELSQDAKKHSKEVSVQSTGVFTAGDTVSIGERSSVDVQPIASVDTKHKKFKFATGLIQDHPTGTKIVPDLTPRNSIKLVQKASAGKTEIHVDNPGIFAVGTRIGIGPRPAKDVVTITEVAGDKYILSDALKNNYAKDAEVNSEPNAYAYPVAYGVGTPLVQEAQAGRKEIFVQDTARFAVGDQVVVGPRQFQDKHQHKDIHSIAKVDSTAQKYTLGNALGQSHPSGTEVTPDNSSAAHDVDWVDAMVRHEIAHSVDTALGGVTGFTQGLGGWWNGDDFDTWAAAMGNAWKPKDGSVISDVDKMAIRQAISDNTDAHAPLGSDQPRDHAINRYLHKGVPVIDAAKVCIDAGQSFWQSPEKILASNGKRFSINPYYKKFQYYNEQVQKSRVRDYAIFAPAEFFAEVYTVYYEEAGKKGAEPGALVPVSSWRTWIHDNVDKRGLVPTKTGTGAPTGTASGPGAPQGAAHLPSAAVGKAAGNPGA